MTINTLILLGTFLISYLAWKNQPMFNKLILHPYTIIREKQYYRLLTSGFIHQGWMHLIFNMIALYFFGRQIEAIFSYLHPDTGWLIYLFFYLSAIVISDLPTIRKQIDNPGYFSLGASGGVSAVVFAWILFFPTETIYVYFIPLPGFILGILYILYSYFQSKNSASHINHDAHLYGAIYGIIFVIVLSPGVVPAFFDQLFNFSIF